TVRADSQTGPADMVIVNGRIWTGVEPIAGPEKEPLATALAIKDSKIIAVGGDAEIRNQVGPSTQVIDANRRRVIPGMTDSHVHMIGGGLQLGRLNLREVKSKEEFIKAVAEAAKKRKPGEWILGGRWSVESWAESASPKKDWIDSVTRTVPVLLWRMDGHQALVNSVALQLTGITDYTPKDPAGGEIERDRYTMAPTGILKESAIDWVERIVPKPSAAELDEALLRAIKLANSFGITSVHDMSEPNHLEPFQRAHRSGALTIRVTSYLSVEDWTAHVNDVQRFPIHDELLRVAGCKGYMDGSLGSRTAYMHEPYADASTDSKYPRGQLTAFANPPETFQNRINKLDEAGLQSAVHAIGDEGIHLLLNAYETVSKNGRKDSRHRVEHAQHLRVEDIPRFAKLGVVASMQPYHKADDARYAEKALGSARLGGSYAFRQLVDAGALVVFGSDFPVVTLDPFAGIHSAVTAKTLTGEVWLKDHSLTTAEALRSYTVWPQKAIHREDQLGTLEAGKLADIAILSEDPLSVPADNLATIRAWKTILGGKIVHSSE
ncbi:MAG: amidohydrolase, partial [Planctomycetota bacterium]